MFNDGSTTFVVFFQFIFAIGVVFVAQVVLGMLAFLTLDMLEDKMLGFTRNAMSDFRKGDDSREIDDAIDYLQETVSSFIISAEKNSLHITCRRHIMR